MWLSVFEWGRPHLLFFHNIPYSAPGVCWCCGTSSVVGLWKCEQLVWDWPPALNIWENSLVHDWQQCLMNKCSNVLFTVWWISIAHTLLLLQTNLNSSGWRSCIYTALCLGCFINTRLLLSSFPRVENIDRKRKWVTEPTACLCSVVMCIWFTALEKWMWPWMKRKISRQQPGFICNRHISTLMRSIRTCLHFEYLSTMNNNYSFFQINKWSRVPLLLQRTCRLM